jgi:hypothetical protein
MANFIEVVENEYGDTILLNTENIVGIRKNGGTIYTNAVHGNKDGLFRFDPENMQKIIEAIKKA